ncbi:MAG: 50S ribosomal protein L30 [Gemmatimonadota bacterium]|nr:50S ribosomal protein L30 [Gemmatimonadota bacterium]
MAEKIRIRQVRSGSNAPRQQQDTLRALGLRHHQAVVEQEDNPTIRGMIRVVSHLVVVEEVE